MVNYFNSFINILFIQYSIKDSFVNYSINTQLTNFFKSDVVKSKNVRGGVEFIPNEVGRSKSRSKSHMNPLIKLQVRPISKPLSHIHHFKNLLIQTINEYTTTLNEKLDAPDATKN